jgi:ribonuclease HI
VSLALQTFSDGGARGNPGPAAVGVVLCDEHGKVVLEASQAIGNRTNNQAEYEALLLALELAHQHKARRLRCYADSELLIYQLQGSYRTKDAQLKTLAEKVKSLAAHFESITYKQVPRSHPMITRADYLLNQTLNRNRAKAPHKTIMGRATAVKDDYVQEELF